MNEPESVVCSAQLVEVIEVSARRGTGEDGDPVRMVVQYWSREGEQLAEHDEWLAAHQRSLAKLALEILGGVGESHAASAHDVAMGLTIEDVTRDARFKWLNDLRQGEAVRRAARREADLLRALKGTDQPSEGA